MKVCPLTRISSPAPGTLEHTVILVGSILQVFQGFMVGLEWESIASQIQFEVSTTTTARHYSMISMIGYLVSARLNILLA